MGELMHYRASRAFDYPARAGYARPAVPTPHPRDRETRA
jgi:hypothetical protein